MFQQDTNPKAKLTKDQVEAIKKLIKKGVPGKDIAEEFKISTSAISRIKNNKTWSKGG